MGANYYSNEGTVSIRYNWGVHTPLCSGKFKLLILTYYNYLEQVGGLFLPGKRNYKLSFRSSSRKIFLFRVQTERKVPVRNVSRSETRNIFCKGEQQQIKLPPGVIMLHYIHTIWIRSHGMHTIKNKKGSDIWLALIWEQLNGIYVKM